MTSLAEKQEARLRLLHGLYAATDGNRLSVVTGPELAEEVGLAPEEFMAAARYLSSEGLVRLFLSGELTITHEGVREVERALQRPEEATEHFPSVVIQQVFQGPVGAVQTGVGSVAHVQQVTGFDAGRVAELVAAIREAIPAEAVDLRETVDDIAEETAKPAPKQSKVRSYLARAGSLAKAYAPVIGLLTELAKVLLGP